MSRGHRPSGSGEEDLLMFFTIYGHGSHLGHVTKIFCINFGLLIIRSLHMKFEFNWANVLLRKLCFNILMGLQYEPPKLKGQRATFLKKINISEIFPFKCIRKQI